MPENVLVADAGHTRTKFAHCRFMPGQPLPQVLATSASIDDAPIDWRKITGWFTGAPPRTSLITGTDLVKARQARDQWPAGLPSPRLLADTSTIPVEVDVDFPERVGVDRLLNAVAANSIRDGNQPAIVVDSGTAVTVDVVSAAGAFSGGAILPGIRLGAESLHAYTTTLPLIDVWELLRQAPEPLGRNTDAAIAAGVYWGHLGAVRELVSRYGQQLRERGLEPLLLLTGGASGILAPYLDGARHEPSLSLQGLALTARETPR